MQGLCDPTHTQVAHTFVRCSRIRKRKPIQEIRTRLQRLNPASIYASLLPTVTHSTSTGLTYLPRIHTYIEINISPPCSNPRSAPPPRRGVFCCGAESSDRRQDPQVVPCRRSSPKQLDSTAHNRVAHRSERRFPHPCAVNPRSLLPVPQKRPVSPAGRLLFRGRPRANRASG